MRPFWAAPPAPLRGQGAKARANINIGLASVLAPFSLSLRSVGHTPPRSGSRTVWQSDEQGGSQSPMQHSASRTNAAPPSSMSHAAAEDAATKHGSHVGMIEAREARAKGIAPSSLLVHAMEITVPWVLDSRTVKVMDPCPSRKVKAFPSPSLLLSSVILLPTLHP
ncbi:MAG: hypothetical protein FRX48_09751 [Lasallia pustulata]|uniref:Uncharacterized protein n=1 Tax=Lasallia pustulata TaxID=136370 RepID=A0A5M8PC07_9LECA|nr:MAG: hypothetical protein FRX48_09751 [Lasallia pustulata]